MIEAALKTLGPCLSTELSAYLARTHGLTDAAARKRVSRSAPGVKRLAHLTFAKNARFVYLQSQFGTSSYWRNLYAAIRATNATYARALDAVWARTAVPIEHFRSACGAPLAQKKQVSADAARDRLVKADVLEVIELPGIGPAVVTRQTADTHRSATDSLVAHVRARLMAESAVLGAIAEWARKLGFASYHKLEARTGTEVPLPRVGPFAWDLTGPSYLSATASWDQNKIKPGWFVCDVLLEPKVSANAVAPFLNKVRAIKNLPRIGRVLFVFVAESYDESALKLIREAGAIPGTLTTMFGSSVSRAFTELVGLLERAGLGTLDVAALGTAVSTLCEFDGAVGNLRGALFEFLVAELVRKRAPGEVMVHKVYSGEDGKAEADVCNVKEGIVARFIECKGVKPGSTVDDEEVKRWLTIRITRIRHYLAHALNWSGPLPIFELWTSGKLSPEAYAMFYKTKRANKRKFELKLVLPSEIRTKAKSTGDKALQTLLENHYLPRQRRKR